MRVYGRQRSTPAVLRSLPIGQTTQPVVPESGTCVSAGYPNWGLHSSAVSHLPGPPEIILIHFFLVNKDNKSSHTPQRLLKLHQAFENKELTKKHLVANVFLSVNWLRSVIFEYLNVGVIKQYLEVRIYLGLVRQIQTGLWSRSLIQIKFPL